MNFPCIMNISYVEYKYVSAGYNSTEKNKQSEQGEQRNIKYVFPNIHKDKRTLIQKENPRIYIFVHSSRAYEKGNQ